MKTVYGRNTKYTFDIPDDVLSYIIELTLDKVKREYPFLDDNPLKRKEVLQKYNDLQKTDYTIIYTTYFNILFVNKQFHRLCSLLKIEWSRILLHSYNFTYKDVDINHIQSKKLLYYDTTLKNIDNDIHRFMKNKQISYRTKKGKIYNGYISIKKLHSMRINRSSSLEKDFRLLTGKYLKMLKTRKMLLKKITEQYNQITRYSIHTKVYHIECHTC